MSKSIIFGMAVTTAMASPAFSGGYIVPVTEVPVAPITGSSPTDFNWKGPYAGGYIGKSSFNLESIGEIRHEPITVEHEEITEKLPAEVIEHPAVIEERVTNVIEHPEITETRVIEEISHPAIVETIPAVIKEHPESKEQVIVDWENVQTGTVTTFIREDVYRDENNEKQRDENHHTGWRHVPVYEDRPVFEKRPVYEIRVVKEAWIEEISPAKEVVTTEAWTETVTETVVVEAARSEEVTETQVVEEAWTEVVKPGKTVVVREAWTEVVRDAWSEQLTDDFSKNGNAYGVFAGYRHQWLNNFVGGIEAYYGKNDSNEFNISGSGEAVKFGTDSYGVEVQAGYAVNRALPYVGVGYANVMDNDAMTLSVGLDYAVTDRLVIGGKYIRYDVGEISDVATSRRFDADGDMVSLRAAIKF